MKTTEGCYGNCFDNCCLGDYQLSGLNLARSMPGEPDNDGHVVEPWFLDKLLF